MQDRQAVSDKVKLLQLLLSTCWHLGTDLGYSFIADFHHHMICESEARFSAMEMGGGVGLYAGQLIGEYIW